MSDKTTLDSWIIFKTSHETKEATINVFRYFFFFFFVILRCRYISDKALEYTSPVEVIKITPGSIVEILEQLNATEEIPAYYFVV